PFASLRNGGTAARALESLRDVNLPHPDFAAITTLAQRASGRITATSAPISDAVRGASLSGSSVGALAINDARKAIEQILTTGDLKTAREVAMPGAQVGINKVRHAYEVGTLDGMPVTGVLKEFGEQAPQEILAAHVAEALGISHLMPVIGARSNGSVLMQYAPGQLAAKVGAVDAASLEAALAKWYTSGHGMTPGDAAARATLDRELVNVFDYVLANADRHTSNVMVDPKSGIVRLLDHGHVGWGQGNDGGTAELPVLGRAFMNSTEVAGGIRHTALSAATVAHLDKIDPAALRTAHASIAKVQNVQRMAHVGRAWAAVQSPEFAGQMVARLERARSERAIRFIEPGFEAPVELWPVGNGRGVAGARGAVAHGGFDQF
ncbi:MAG TPA: hypothetical protein VIM34_08835, partial [Burkholderiaceae bacterium]